MIIIAETVDIYKSIKNRFTKRGNHMIHKIDAKGLACPQPVVLTKNRMKEFSHIEIIVDNETAVENIKRLAESSQWSFEQTVSGADFIINIKSDKPQTAGSEKEAIISCGISGSTIVFSSDKMGKGDDDLGAILMKAFIHTILSLENIPSALVLYNSGVLLAAENSGAADDLQALHEKGVEILICGTCVNFYNISDKIKTGTISNMYDILNRMNSAARLINP
ncbi:MAG: sulfurtransferase-like selenium metabolism protein YedF [Spirochaetae bacterium HGW-Spirochaetae-5]|nr:MAG: sulfurtransferase-like selenium metabolism protein YedF [Spirochaetae bacterium HGW-Spirochaetae-5]